MNKRKNSLILIGLVCVVTLVISVWVYLNQIDSNKVTISVDGIVIDELSLSKDQTYYYSVNGDENVIEIKNGEVRVIYSNCHNQICVNSFPISHNFPGVICCLPHGLIIEMAE